MHFGKWLVVLAILAISKAAEVSSWMEDPEDWRNKLGRDATADDYLERGLDLPPLAKPVTTIEKGQSYIAKLGCLGCPSRNRLPPEEDGKERWEDVVQETSLLLNLTVTADKKSLLLNGESILPLYTRPPSIYAFQTPTNLTADFLQAIIALDMLDQYYQLEAKYNAYELSYQLSTLQQTGASKQLMQFDVTDIGLVGNSSFKYSLDESGLQVIQLHLIRNGTTKEVVIEDVKVVDWSQSILLKPEALDRRYWTTKAIYQASEWDSYGRKGSWLRTFRLTIHYLNKFIADCFPIFVVALIVLIVALSIRWCVVMRRRAAGGRNRVEEVKVTRFKGQDLKLAREKDQA